MRSRLQPADLANSCYVRPSQRREGGFMHHSLVHRSPAGRGQYRRLAAGSIVAAALSPLLLSACAMDVADMPIEESEVEAIGQALTNLTPVTTVTAHQTLSMGPTMAVFKN